jgi:putative chitinase
MALLKNGSTGDLVKKLQAKLGLATDGNFGPGTERALKAWQQANGLEADGLAGNATLAAMDIDVDDDTAKVSKPGELNLAALKGHVPDSVIVKIPETAAKFGINTPIKLAHFLAQCGHESGGFKVTSENLNYSAEGLKTTFKKYFPTVQAATPFAKNPEKIANKVYANRMGNGNEASGEGYKFRGRGFIQLTGKDNYKAFGAAIGIDLISNPDLVATNYALLSAAWFFHKNSLRKCIDASAASVLAVTKSVNGGTIGLEDRKKHFKEYYDLLT